MSDDEISEEGRRRRFAQWEQLGVDVIRTDLEATGGRRFVGGPPAVRKLAWEWVRSKEVSSSTGASSRFEVPVVPPTPAERELVTLKPTLWGVGIDLKEVGRRVYKWWRGRTK